MASVTQITLQVLSCTFYVSLLVIVFAGFANSELNLPLDAIEKWAKNFGNNIHDVSVRATGLHDLKAAYLLMHPKVKPISGSKMIRDMKFKMEDMLSKKVEAIRKLVDVAESAHEMHIINEHLTIANISYPKAKKLNVGKEGNKTEFILEENEHFNYIPVNLTMSTVHVPTNVYDESTEVLNGVDWSEALDATFRENYENDPTLTWQYFGSASGFFRNYPGAVWNTENFRERGIDTYDCRVRGWYIQAATSPKDIVILLDASGSMKGLRMEIAKATVEKILDTLSDDDFFNVLKFSENLQYADDCFNGTLVQANADNKKRIKEALAEVDTQNIAYFDKALTEAFELLRAVNDSGKGARCNKAIMLITDGAPETYEEIFKRYNWPKKDVRVFTFLIGREVGDSRQVKWMACSNKGYFSHISTLADVHEHVQDYIHVLSRPMVIKRSNHTIWTSVYGDAADFVKTVSRPMVIAHPNLTIWTPVYMSADSEDFSQHDTEGLNLMTSVAQPVFDTKNDTTDSGILLGVMGTDVPLKELTKLTPQYKLGVNGYAFAITNNGYILFHPDFRPTKGGIVKPNYNSVDLAEVELSDVEREGSNYFVMDDEASPNYDIELRTEMVDRKTGDLEMTVKIHYDDMKRVTVRKNHYFYTPIDDTPFSLGIALPDGYGLNELDGRIKLKDADLNSLRSRLIKIATWNYCKMDTNETKQDAVEMLLKYLEYGQARDDQEKLDIYNEQCDNELIESLLFDAAATRGALSSWMKENWDGEMNESTSRRNGIELVFIGTKGGLTRYMTLTNNLTDPEFLETNNDTIEELYYKRAVEGGVDILTFSVPYNAGESFDWNSTVLTASTPIFIRDYDDNGRDNKREAVAAVVGLQMRYDKFYEHFMNVSKTCPVQGMNCNHTCHSNEIDCYLLDNNGFVILSETPEYLGKFFGELDGTMMRELIMGDGPKVSTGVFKKIQMYDYQGICDIWRKEDSSATSIFIDPLRQLISSTAWLVQEVALFLVQFNIYSWWNGEYATASAGETVRNYSEPQDYYDNKPYMPPFEELLEMGTRQELSEWINTFRELQLKGASDEKIREWFRDLKKRIGPRLIGHNQCAKELFIFDWDKDKIPSNGAIDLSAGDCMTPCKKSYSINSVPHTNLMLLAVDAQCYCTVDPPITVEPVEVIYNETMMCQRLQTEIYRKRPEQCYFEHPAENSTDCGRCSLLQPSVATILLLLTSRALISSH